MADMPNKLFPGDAIELSDEDAQFLGGGLVSMISDLERLHSRYFNDVGVWWRWFEAIPKQETKNYPFRNASNLIVPLIQSQTLALTNKLIGMVFANDNRIWMHRTQNGDHEKVVMNLLRYQNWAANGNQFDFRTPIIDGVNELIPIGETHWAVNWHNEMRHVFTGQKSKRNTESQPLLFSRGPLVEHVPREQILYDPAYDVQDAPFVVREFQLTYDDILGRAEDGDATPKERGWIMDNVEAIRGAEGLHGPGAKVTKIKEQDIDNMWRTPSQSLMDIREVHVDFPVFQSMKKGEGLALPGNRQPGSPTIGLVFTLHRSSGRIIRAVAEPYNFGRKPIVSAYFQKRPGRGHSVGLAKKLHHMQSAMTTLLNQALDSRTRANAIFATTSVRDLANRELDPAVALHVPLGQDYNVLDISKNTLNDMSLFNVVNILSERLTGQADPVMGRESRSGGHPSPATSTLALLGQSDQMISTLRMSVRGAISDMGEMIASMYQQFVPDPDELIEVLGETDALSVGEYLAGDESVLGRIHFDVVGMSKASNPEAEMQKVVQMMSANINFWSFVGQVLQTGMQAEQQGVKGAMEIAIKSIEAQTKFQERLLEAGDVDDVEDFIINIREALGQSNQDAQAIGGQLGGVAQGGGAVPGPGVGGPGGAPGGGSVVPPGAFG